LAFLTMCVSIAVALLAQKVLTPRLASD
jgi:hypothetical protein